jgi:hypothetical protein
MSEPIPRWLAIGGTAASILGVGLAIWVFARTRSERLTADVYSGAFRFPPSAGTYSVPPDSLLSLDDIASAVGLRGEMALGDSGVAAMHRRLVQRLGLSIRAKQKDYGRLESYWDVRVANTGSKALTNVRLTYPSGVEHVCAYLSDCGLAPSSRESEPACSCGRPTGDRQ